MITLKEDIYRFGLSFHGRIPENMLLFALDYTRFNEIGMALDTLCDYICEYDVSISKQEFAKITELNSKLYGSSTGAPLSKNLVSYLKTLIR